MHSNKLCWYFLLFTLFPGVPVQSQNQIRLEKKGFASLEFSDLAEKSIHGQAIADSSIRINYSTLVSPAEPPLSVTAEIAGGQVPEGFQVFIEARPINGIGLDNQGRTTGKIPLGPFPRVILESIRTNQTAIGAETGHQIIISFEITDFSLIEPGSTSLYVKFSLNRK